MADKAVKEKKPLMKKLQTALVALAVIAVAVGSVVYGISYVMRNEGTAEIEAEHVASLTAAPEDEQGVIDYLTALYAKLSDPLSVKVNVKNSVNIPEASVAVASNEKGLVEALRFARQNIANNIGGKYYTEFKGVFGEDFAGNLPVCGFAAGDVDYAVCAEGAQEQLLKGFAEAAKKDKKPEDYNYIYISFPVNTLEQFEAGALNESFGLDEAQGVIDALKADTAEKLEIKAENIECSDFSIAARANRFTDEIDYAVYTRNYTVTLDVVFTGELAEYGEQTISFEYNAVKRYEFTYAGIRITENVLYVERGDEVEVPNLLGVEQEAEEALPMTWTSSNESVATVTNNGFVTGEQASAEPVTITAEIEYLGRKYTSQCLVYVINPVKNITVSKKELTLSVGGTQSLTYTLDPDDATITAALWFTGNEAVATVDENGLVTAVSPGTAEIYVVSKDQHFKSTCTVTVE